MELQNEPSRRLHRWGQHKPIFSFGLLFFSMRFSYGIIFQIVLPGLHLWNSSRVYGILLAKYYVAAEYGNVSYVLSPELQDGKKIPKWHPRSRRGMFVGYSPVHSSTVGQVLIWLLEMLVPSTISYTMSCSPPYRVLPYVMRKLFQIVPSDMMYGTISLFLGTDDMTVYVTPFKNKRLSVIPLLGNDWLTPSATGAR
jgi:hypothetical protein